MPAERLDGGGEVSVALVTGAQRGIGKAIALELARSGLDVAVLDYQVTDALRGVVRDIEALGRRSAALAADIGDISGHRRVLDGAQSALGPLTCLVNNAGVSVLKRGDLLDVTPESYDRCLQVNTRGTFFLTQAFAKRLLQQPAEPGTRRTIVTITSSNAVAASVARGEYCISKAGLSMACTLFALRLAEHGVDVYEIQPGLIETEMSAPSRSRYDQQMEAGLTAIRRWGKPEEVAHVVATLVRGGLPYTVGQPIRVDGGLLIPKF
jgi:NAD(P)-dependent dehydrogenase (short-subunit alcohol dehydrogenase family)